MKKYWISGLLAAATLCLGVAAAEDQQVRTGVVTHAEVAGAYLFLKLDEAGEERWLASMPFEVAVGEQVEYTGGDTMGNFTSKAMNRTFDSIHFVSRIHVVGRDDAPQADAGMPGAADGGMSAPDMPPMAGALTSIGEIFARRDTLAGAQVMVRAEVVKVSANILGTNWITLSDGTGQAPDDRLVVRTADLPAVGDTVIAAGTVATGIELGSDYRYAVLLDGATVMTHGSGAGR